jgi:hypothetical protein
MRIAPNRKEVEYTITESGCHVCTSHSLRDGYPQVNRGGRKGLLSRHILREKLGRELQEGLGALHTCGNRLCINPEHLYEGTATDNMLDSLYHGTANCLNMIGEKCPWSKLTEEDVRYIRNHPEETQRSLAKKYGVSATVVWRARKGLSWSHIKDKEKVIR